MTPFMEPEKEHSFAIKRVWRRRGVTETFNSAVESVGFQGYTLSNVGPAHHPRNVRASGRMTLKDGEWKKKR